MITMAVVNIVPIFTFRLKFKVMGCRKPSAVDEYVTQMFIYSCTIVYSLAGWLTAH